MYIFAPIDFDCIDKQEFNDFPAKTIFTTPEWIGFVQEDSHAKPIVLEILKGEKKVGYFTALLVEKFGIRIVASPFSGWSTCFMGFDVLYVNKIEIVTDLVEYLYRTYRCSYIEIVDRDITVEDAQHNGFVYRPVSTLELAIERSDNELFKVFKTDCRNFIRQFERRGATIEEAVPDDDFAEEYYSQLKDVFAKQGMVPTYGIEKIKRLLSHLANTGMLLCLRVREPDGLSIATSIFLGHNKKFFFWGGASLRPFQSFRPNEYMIWYAIKYWRERGCTVFDMVGVRDYKKKFGAVEKEYAKLIIPRYGILLSLRNCAEKLYFLMLRFKGFLARKR